MIRRSRDGTQREGISLSCDDKLEIARKLDDIGVDFIEGGWPGSNPKGCGILPPGHARFLCGMLSLQHSDRRDVSGGDPLDRSKHPGVCLMPRRSVCTVVWQDVE